MEKDKSVKLFEEKTIRTHWDTAAEKWYFSVVDTIAILTDSENPRRYWSDLKRKLKAEGSQLYEKIVQLKMPSSDGKFYRPVKKQVSLRIDADILAWFKHHHSKYQSAINNVLHKHVHAQ